MVYHILLQLEICYLILVNTPVAVVGEQWEIGTWAPEDLNVNISNTPSVSELTTTPTGVVKEASLSYPSMEPSDSPSKSPSSTPTASHAPSISSAPIAITISPSFSPSLLPSSMPTPQCHDHENYRSPLNSLNCTQHLGTDCFQWKHLGLTDVQVEDLINSCPKACDIECKSLFVFETNQTYDLQFVDNFLSPESTALFEDASTSYVEKYVLEKHPQSRFSLNRVELLSQRVLEKVGPTRRLIRSLQAPDSHLVDLEINVGFRGFVLYLTIGEIEVVIKEGIQTFGYMRALRFTNDPALQDVEVALDIQVNPADQTPTAAMGSSKANSSLPWIVTVAILSSVGIAVIVIVYMKVSRRNTARQSDKDFDSPIISPAASARSNIIPNLSYESIVRFAPNNVSQRSGTPTSMVDSTGDDSSLKSSPNASIISTTESGEEEHPLTGIVPSMIVYDCIDGSDELVDVIGSKEKVKDVVPTRHLAATVSFRKALQENSLDVLDKTMFTGIPEKFSHMAIIDASKDQVNKKIPKLPSESEEISTSDAATVRAGASERHPLGEPELSHEHAKEILLRQNRGDKRNEPNEIAQNCNLRRYQLHHGHGRQIKIHAPRVGKLGLVIQSSESHGHVVMHVKEYSPIREEINVGDRIIFIDGQDTTSMTLLMVTKLISGSNNESSSTAKTLDIIVWRGNSEALQRKYMDVPVRAPGHQRSVSGSSSRSATSAPPIGSGRPHEKFHTAHRSRNTTMKVKRDGHNPYRVSSQGSVRSASSTPNMYRSRGRSTHITNIPPSFSKQRTQSRSSDTFIDTHRRLVTPPLIHSSLSMTNTQPIGNSNEC